MRLFLAIISLLLLMYSCKRNTNGICEILYIENAFENNEGVNLSKYASDIRYIPLETTPQSLIGLSISNIVTTGDYLYLISQNRGDSHVLMFNNNGNFIQKIGAYGRGPGEYSLIKDLMVENDLNNRIAIHSHKKIIIYNNGNFVKEISLDAFTKATGSNTAMACRYASNGKYELISQQKNHNSNISKDICTIIDSTGNVLSITPIGNTTYFISNRGGIQHSVSQSANFFKNTYNALFINSRGDTISYINENNIRIVSHILKLGKYQSLADNNNFEEKLQIGIINLNNTEKFLTIGFSAPARTLPELYKGYHSPNKIAGRLIYDKKEKKLYTLKYNPEFNLSGFNNDLNNGAPFVPVIAIGNKMYSFTDAATFISHAQKCNSQQMKEVASKITPESNYVLTEVTLK